MDQGVKKAIGAAIESFARVSNYPASDFGNRLTGVFNADMPFMEKVSAMDELVDEEPQLEVLREIFFDLLLLNFFSEDVKKLEADYLDSPEWEAIEEETIDRGTELLNLLLYLVECRDEQIEPELEDFLTEFLLVNEDEFQDEHRIYEDVIANQILIESNYGEIARIASKLDESSEIKELFYPMMSFFHQPKPSAQAFETFISCSEEPELDAPVYSILTSYYTAK